ncbi:hypothetical protein [Embleya sp. NPDC005575]|uniref:hypothetical protein n=1 Tax=Embleya sp. NPDC005575 TaxID=3156892 RepID=UPI0033A74AB4
MNALRKQAETDLRKTRKLADAAAVKASAAVEKHARAEGHLDGLTTPRNRPEDCAECTRLLPDVEPGVCRQCGGPHDPAHRVAAEKKTQTDIARARAQVEHTKLTRKNREADAVAAASAAAAAEERVRKAGEACDRWETSHLVPQWQATIEAGNKASTAAGEVTQLKKRLDEADKATSLSIQVDAAIVVKKAADEALTAALSANNSRREALVKQWSELFQGRVREIDPERETALIKPLVHFVSVPGRITTGRRCPRGDHMAETGPAVHVRRWHGEPVWERGRVATPQLDLAFFRHRSHPVPAFGDRARVLRIAVDARAAARASTDSRVGFLLEFTRHPLVEIAVLGTADDLANPPAPGRIEVGEVDETEDYVQVRVPDGDGWALTGALGYRSWVQWAETASCSGAGTVDDVLAEVVRARASLAWPADLLVTDSPLLLAGDGQLVLEANPMDTPSALALMGLFLRDRGDFTHALTGGTPRRWTAESFYEFTVRAALPAGWRFHSAARAASNPTMGALAETIIHRAARALFARDHVLARTRAPHDRPAVFEILYHLDALLVQTVGALDALARITDTVCGLNTKPQGISWRSETWRRKVNDATPGTGLPALLPVPPAPSGRQLDTIRLVTTLRNNVHNNALRLTTPDHAYSSFSRFRMHLPQTDHDAVTRYVADLGGDQAWGVRTTAPGETTLDLARFVDTLLRESLRTIDDLMRHIPVERLPGVDPANITHAPDPDHPFHGTAAATALRDLCGLS